VNPSLGAALALGCAYAAVGSAVAIVAAATRTLHLAVGQVLVAGVLVHLVLVSPAVGLPLMVALLVAVGVGAVVSASLGPLVIDRLPSGAPVLVGLVVAAGVIDAVAARAVTARPVVARPLLDLPTVAGLDPRVVTAVVLGLPIAAGCAALLRGTRWGRLVRLVGGSPPAVVALGRSPAAVRAGALGLAGSVAVVAGLLAAPLVTIGTAQAGGLTVRAVAAATLLGLGGPVAAVAGGLLLGATEVLGGALWPAAGAEVAVAVVVVGALVARGDQQRRSWGRAW
jgi:branched-chain amino acid transport system permease protein